MSDETKDGKAPVVTLSSEDAAKLPEKPEPDQYERDERGRFVSGNIGGGRPPGSKNRLAEDFIADFHAAWREHGVAALEKMATEDHGAFVRAAVQLMPKDVLVDARGGGLIVVKMDETDLNL